MQYLINKTPSMNTTAVATASQMQNFRKQPNLMEVPSLLNTPDSLHPLYAGLRKNPLVQSFTQLQKNCTAELRIEIREGEIINQVVLQRIKNLFKKHPTTFLVEGKIIKATIKL